MGAPADEARTVEVYAAVIRRLVNQDNTFGGQPTPFKKVFVLDAPVANAQHSWEPHRRSAPFSEGMRRELKASLADLPPLQFVSDAEEGRSSEGVVREHGVIITLGQISAAGDHVQVPNGMYCGNTCGQWLTYLVDRTGDGWLVRGNTGEVMIS